MPNPNETTGTLTYVKLLIIAKLFRGGFVFGNKMRGLLGQSHPIHPDRQVRSETIDIPSSKSQRRIQVTVYKNEAALEAAKRGEKSAAHIHWYGGGWMLPHMSSQTLPLLTAVLSSPALASYPLTIFDATYALSPEHPCPAELEDARDVYSHVLAHPNIWDKDRITFSGCSSGGAIALGLAVALGIELKEVGRTHPMNGHSHPVKAVVVYYAMTSWVGIAERNTAFLASLPKKKAPRVMPNFVMDTVTAAHFFSPSGSAQPATKEDEAARKEALQRMPMVSPALADAMDFPPRVGIWTVEWDVMSTDADELRKRLQNHHQGGERENVEVSGRNVKGVGHGWDLEVHEGQLGWEERAEAYNDLVKAIAWAGGLAVE